MKRFRFPLQQILKYREQRTKQADLRLRATNLELAAARAEQAAAEERLDQQSHSFAQLCRRPVGIETLRCQSLYSERLGHEQDVAEDNVQQVERRLVEVRRVRTKAAADEEALKQLRELRLREHRYEQSLEFQVQVDEISMRRWSRQQLTDEEDAATARPRLPR